MFLVKLVANYYLVQLEKYCGERSEQQRKLYIAQNLTCSRGGRNTNIVFVEMKHLLVLSFQQNFNWCNECAFKSYSNLCSITSNNFTCTLISKTTFAEINSHSGCPSKNHLINVWRPTNLSPFKLKRSYLLL